MATPSLSGIRNVTHIDKALAEAYRVLKHGGRFFCLEFSTTEWPGFKEVYDAYSHHLVPRIGEAIAGNAESYRYLIESIRRFPPMPEFEAMIRHAGFVNTRVEPIWAGWSRSIRGGRSEVTRPVAHIFRLLRWGRTLARHGALRGIENDPNTPPQVRRLVRIARLGTFQPKVPDYAGAFQAIGPAAIQAGANPRHPS